MVKVIPPASTLYWPSTITVWSAPVPNYSVQPNTLLWSGFGASGTTWYYFYSGSDQTFVSIATFRIITPGNYEIRFEFTGGTDVTRVRILVNNNINTVVVGESNVIKQTKVQLTNLRGNSIVEIQIAASQYYPVYLRNIQLYGGRNAIVFLQNVSGASTTTVSTSNNQTVQPTLDEQIQMPPPSRIVSNVPSKLKGKYMIY